MPSESFGNVLYDIRDNILLAQEFVAGLDFQTFSASRLHFYAVTRAVEIISEASKRLPDEVRARHPRLPWRDIRDVGNFRPPDIARFRGWNHWAFRAWGADQ
jgi:uncharacterized protein with HEPN domain